MSTKEAHSTKPVYGVPQNAIWRTEDRNHRKFFIPTSMVDEQEHRPIKMLVELWDKDMYSHDDFMSSNIVNVRPVTEQIDSKRELRLKMRDGNHLDGTLTMKLSYTEILSVEDHTVLQQNLKRKEKQQHKLARKLPKEAKRIWDDLILKKRVREQEVTYGMMEVEVLRFDGRQKDQSFWQKYMLHFLCLFFVVSWLFLFAALWTHLEGWPYVTSLYFVVVVSATIGYGDYVPSTTGSKVACCIFGIGSGLILFVSVTSAIGEVLEIRNLRRQRKKESRKRREQMMDRISGTPKLKRPSHARNDSKSAAEVDTLERESTNQQLKALGLVPKHEHKILGQLLPSLLIWIMWLVTWTLYFAFFSETTIPVFDALYFGLATAGMIGFGDFSAKVHEGDQVFIICTAYIGVAAWVNLATETAVVINMTYRRGAHRDILANALATINDLKEFDDAQMGDSITEANFMRGMLIKMKLVDQSILDQIKAKFLESGGMDGRITKDGLKENLDDP